MIRIDDQAVDRLRRIAQEPDLSGTRYRFVELLGHGGMGVVYRVHDTGLGRDVAMKVAGPSCETADLGERLRREARVLAGLEHPSIVPVHDVGVLADGRVYAVMKLVRGDRLDRWRESGPSRAAALRLFQKICEAVAFAHSSGVIHRDLKPANIMIGPFGEALVMDWGLARARASGPPTAEATSASDRLAGPDTGHGVILGTPGYMSPEQASGTVAELDARTDVFALGALLRYLLVERPPDGDRPPRRPFVERRSSRALEAVCQRALAADPADRYASATEMAADIGRFLDDRPVEAHRETALERLSRLAVRHRTLLYLLAAYVLMRLVLLLVFR